ncbi:MAG: carotenoid biosynthesis protein [Caldilineaceae bacterium]|nr:carotenoid biosynthesis protein [Caldilineaceae bacterium]
MHSTVVYKESERNQIQIWRQQMRQAMTPLAWTLYIIWLLFMIMVPHILRLGTDQALIWGLNAAVILQTATVLAVIWPHWGATATLRAAVIVAILSWGMEALGSSTGFPFGSYDYTDRLQPHLFHVPLLIPLAWLMMLAPSWAIADSLAGRRSGLLFALVSGLATTAWDLFLDPQMVAWNLWVWAHPGGYFGIPWVNYAGWIFTGALITLVVRPRRLPILPMLLIYATTWLLESIGLAFFFNLPGPALAGFLGMGIFVVAAVWRIKKGLVIRDWGLGDDA